MRVLPVIAALVLAGPGCSLALEPGEQCDTTEDCVARGFAGAVCSENVCEVAEPVDSQWGCLGKVPKPMPDPSRKITFTLQLTALDRSPISEAVVDICDKLDLECTDPDTPKGLIPDEEGRVELTVKEGFDGYFRMTGPDFIVSRFYVGEPLLEAPNIKAVQLIAPADYQLIVAYAKKEVDPTRGTAIFYVADCARRSADGVAFSSPSADEESQLFYLIDQLPALPPAATATDIYGFGGVLNLPVGPAVVIARRASDDAFIGQVGFGVFEGAISYVLVTPSPT